MSEQIESSPGWTLSAKPKGVVGTLIRTEYRDAPTMESQSTDTSAPLLALAATRAEDSAGSAAQSDLTSLMDLGLEPLVDFGDGNEAYEVHADPVTAHTLRANCFSFDDAREY